MPDTNHRNPAAEKVSKPFLKNWWVWVVIAIGICPFLFFAVVLGYQYVFQLPKAKEALAQLEIEFKTIAPLPSTKIVDHESSSKMSQAFVEATYFTDAGFTDIFNYYDEQLKQHGWQLKSNDGLGGKVADYCKGEYNAELQYSGPKTNSGWTYSFSMSWGLDDCN